jgi:hypothetical protein
MTNDKELYTTHDALGRLIWDEWPMDAPDDARDHDTANLFAMLETRLAQLLAREIRAQYLLPDEAEQYITRVFGVVGEQAWVWVRRLDEGFRPDPRRWAHSSNEKGD